MANAIKEKSTGPQQPSRRDYVCSGSWRSTCERPDRKDEVGTFEKLKGNPCGWSAVLAAENAGK